MKLDDFEAVFRSSVKAQFHHKAPELTQALLVTDLDAEQTELALAAVKQFLGPPGQQIAWATMNSVDFGEAYEVLDRVRRNPPHLVACCRQLLGRGPKLPYSLGTTIDALTQATDVPVLLLPRPVEGEFKLPRATHEVMVVTDHLTGDDHLVNWAAYLCEEQGTLYLTHVEDQDVLNKYLDVCSKIPGIDNELASTKIPQKLLDMPRDYIESTAAELLEHGAHKKVVPIVCLGDPVREYARMMEEHNIDLLVMNTKDEGQTAMHALAYALAVEIRDRPLLLL